MRQSDGMPRMASIGSDGAKLFVHMLGKAGISAKWTQIVPNEC